MISKAATPIAASSQHAHAHDDAEATSCRPKGPYASELWCPPSGTMYGQPGGGLAGWWRQALRQRVLTTQLAAAIHANTAAILYIKSHHCVQKSIRRWPRRPRWPRPRDPLIVDAAAEEDLRLYGGVADAVRLRRPRPSRGRPAARWAVAPPLLNAPRL